MTRGWAGSAGSAGDAGVIRQTMAAELVTRGDGWERGTRSVLLANDRVSVEVVVDRGMDLAAARVDGIPVGWRSPTPIVAPWFVEQSGFGPHRAFFGGLLTTGGPDHIGAPSTESAERFRYPARRQDGFPMHGRWSGSPAVLRGYGVDTSGVALAWVLGEIAQVAVFGENLLVERRVELRFGETTVRVADRVRNLGYATSPAAVLYHVNAGWPVAVPGARIRRPDGGLGAPLEPPSSETMEHVELFEVAPAAAEASITSRLGPEEVVGMRVGWDGAVLPGFVEWRLLAGAGHYAVALEPTTLRRDGDALVHPLLEPGESIDTGVEIELVHHRITQEEST
ncbi:MAG: hypothetical protein DI534_04860 [Leifsonia xyli]|nr:MAG: hypothetical protein DI534_04860 [Leifsonia xyli]